MEGLFDIFGTVQVPPVNLETDFTRGFIIYNKVNHIRYDDVIIGKYNSDIPLWIGNNVKVLLCRMVLVEKFDKKLHLALEKVMDGKYYIL